MLCLYYISIAVFDVSLCEYTHWSGEVKGGEEEYYDTDTYKTLSYNVYQYKLHNPKPTFHKQARRQGGGGGWQGPPMVLPAFSSFCSCLSAQSRKMMMIIPLYTPLVIILPQTFSADKKNVSESPPPPPSLSKHPGPTPAHKYKLHTEK